MSDEMPMDPELLGMVQQQMNQQATATVFARDVLTWLTSEPDMMQRFHESLCTKAAVSWKIRGKTPPDFERTKSNLEFTQQVLDMIVDSLYEMGLLGEPEIPNQSDPSLS
jgi:hypothetical protein